MHQRLMGTTKKITGAIAAIALLIMVTMVTFAFTNGKSKRIDKLAPTTNWYSVTITGLPASNPANQSIGSAISGSPTPPCGELSGIVCAVRLTLDDGVTKPTTVAQANTMEANDEGVDVLGSSFREDN